VLSFTASGHDGSIIVHGCHLWSQPSLPANSTQYNATNKFYCKKERKR
jgi:hypothetical protein